MNFLQISQYFQSQLSWSSQYLSVHYLVCLVLRQCLQNLCSILFYPPVSGSTSWETAKYVTSQKSMKFNKQIGTIDLKVIQLLFQQFLYLICF